MAQRPTVTQMSYKFKVTHLQRETRDVFECFFLLPSSIKINVMLIRKDFQMGHDLIRATNNAKLRQSRGLWLVAQRLLGNILLS